MLTQVHGSVDSARCNGCGQARDISLVRDAVRCGEVPKCTDCNGVVRPNVVMFGEPIADVPISKVADCDVMLILGTSLMVPPISDLPSQCPHDAVRVYVNLSAPPSAIGFEFGTDRDVFLQCPTDEAIPAFVAALEKRGVL